MPCKASMQLGNFAPLCRVTFNQVIAVSLLCQGSLVKKHISWTPPSSFWYILIHFLIITIQSSIFLYIYTVISFRNLKNHLTLKELLKLSTQKLRSGPLVFWTWRLPLQLWSRWNQLGLICFFLAPFFISFACCFSGSHVSMDSPGSMKGLVLELSMGEKCIGWSYSLASYSACKVLILVRYKRPCFRSLSSCSTWIFSQQRLRGSTRERERLFEPIVALVKTGSGWMWQLRTFVLLNPFCT